MAKRGTFILGLVFILAGGLVLSGCTGGRTAGQALDDSWIMTKVKSLLTKEKASYSVDINVDVLDFEVTLRGHVDSVAEKQRVEALVSSVKGVRSVNNLLVVIPPTEDDVETRDSLSTPSSNRHKY